MASSAEPPYLHIGTDVSAKYRGAFCEAKVKKIVKSVKIKVFVKDTQSNVLVTDEDITGPLKVGATVEVKHPDTGNVSEGFIKHMIDASMYTVVFDDADERTLRRTQICLKGDKHFTESETLDNLPLSNPEHFGTPVMAKGKRIRTSAGVCEPEESDESTDEEGSPRRKIYRGSNQDLVGKIMFYDSGERKKSNTPVPCLVCLPDAHTTDLKTKDHMLLKSFKDGKFFSAARKDLITFTREAVLKNEDKGLKPAMEKALLFLDNSELPVQWNREELIGSDDEEDNDVVTSEDDEQSEEKDRFVAQLYKFSDDRGTPINKGPSIGTKDLDLFRLFKVVQNLGGYNRVTNQMKWRLVYSKMLLPPSNTASTQIKNAYKKYLHAFEDFYRKLGSSMGTISRPSRGRHGSGRSIMNFRDKEKPSEKTDSDKEKGGDDSKSEFDSDAESISKQSGSGTPKRAKSARVKLELKDTKESKDEKKEDKKEDKQDTKKEEKEGKRNEESVKKGKKTMEDKKDKKADNKEESDKKVLKKKDDGTSPVTPRKKDSEDELKDLQRKISRRRSARMDERIEEEESAEVSKKEDQKKEEVRETKRDKKEEKKEEIKEKKKEEMKEKKKEEKEEKLKKEAEENSERKPRRREYKKKVAQDESDESEIDGTHAAPSTPVASSNSDLPVGAKLKVKYGRGRNASEYEAKILEVGTDSGHRQYLVHYQGWNTRHDEWIKNDRIVKVLDRPDSGKKGQKPSPKPWLKGPKKKALNEKQPASPSSVKSDSSASQGTGRSRDKVTKPQTPTHPSSGGGTTTASSKGRPTRSNSIESKIADGLPAKRRAQKAPSISESANGSDSENNDNSEDETDPDSKPEVEKEVSATPSSSMPMIISKKGDEEEEGEELDEDTNLDRSPPKLSKVTDLSKEKMEEEEKVEEAPKKVEVKEEKVAPVLKVENEKNSQPILQKMEAQLNASNALNSNTAVSEEKDTKKRDFSERRVKKIGKEKPEGASSPKRTEKLSKEDKSTTKEEKSINKEDKAINKEEKTSAKEEKLSKKEVKVSNKEVKTQNKEENAISKDQNAPNEDEKAPISESPDTLDSAYEFKDDPEDKMEIKTHERKKQVVVLPQVTLVNSKETVETNKDEPSNVDKQKTADEISTSNKPEESISKNIKPNLLASDKEAAKSDSEVEKIERRGRKKKLVNKDESPKEVKKPKLVTVEKKILDAPNLIEKKMVNVHSERKPFITLAEKKQGFSPIVRKVHVVATEKYSEPESTTDNVPVDESDKIKTDIKEEVKKVTEMVVVHKESPVKSDIVVGRKTESSVQEDEDKPKSEDDRDDDESLNDPQIVKKKVRKKTKKKAEMAESVSVTKKTVKTRALSAKVKESVRKVKDTRKVSEDESAIDNSAIDIDLRCEESIRSRSASPEPVKHTSTVTPQESQGFEFFVQTVTSQLHESQQGTSGLQLRDDKSKSLKRNVFENTPPTTPEHDSDEASQHHRQNEQIKVNNKELGSKPDTSHNEGNESPRGNVSPSSNGSGGSSGVIAGSEGSLDVPVHNKRQREPEENTPSKRRKRVSRGKAAANRARQIAAESDTDEASNMSSKCRSPHYSSESYTARSIQNTNRSPRPLKYNFNLEEGKYLEGNDRISFLIDKIQEIRKLYVNLKSEVASIDRRRKKLRRREKESASSSAVEVECS